MKYTAKILTPTGRAIQLGAEEIDNLVVGVANDGLLTCWGEAVEQELGHNAVDVLTATATYAVWGLENAADFARRCPLGTSAVERLTGQHWPDLYGPILIVEAA